jgi:hypothetical protein
MAAIARGITTCFYHIFCPYGRAFESTDRIVQEASGNNQRCTVGDRKLFIASTVTALGIVPTIALSGKMFRLLQTMQFTSPSLHNPPPDREVSNFLAGVTVTAINIWVFSFGMLVGAELANQIYDPSSCLRRTARKISQCTCFRRSPLAVPLMESP